MNLKQLSLISLFALAACGGGTYTIDIKQDGTPIGNGTVTVPATSSPAPSPTPVASPASAPSAAPAPAAPPVTVGIYPTTLLQMGDTWMEDGVWGAAGLTRGTYTGITGTTYEQSIGVSPQLGPNKEVAGRITWKFPTGTTEVKSYPSFIVGAKPGWQNSWILPGGFNVQLPDGTMSQVYPSGATPNTWLPLQLSTLPPIYSSFSYHHNEAATGRGQLTYDIFLQNAPAQCHGFNNCNEITHEIMIPLDFWGGYGQYKAGGGGRNPSWYIQDVTIDGNLFHLFAAKNADGTLTENFSSGWKFIVFEPDQPIAPGTINVTSFLKFIQTMKDSAGTPWANGSEWLVSVELGVEAVDGTGDLTLFNYRVWK
jgi:hypothetical protein